MQLFRRESPTRWVLFQQISDLQKPGGEAVGVFVRRLVLVNGRGRGARRFGLERRRTRNTFMLNFFLGPFTLCYGSCSRDFSAKTRIRRGQ